MEFFGVTLYGPQNYLADLIKEGYREPEFKEEVEPLMKNVISHSTCADKVVKISVRKDCLMRGVSGILQTRVYQKPDADGGELLMTEHTGIQRPDVSVIRLIDCYMGRVNGFAYGSIQRFNKMKRKGVIKPAGPADIYRLPPTTSLEIGWFQCDPALANQAWYETNPRYPAPVSPTTLIYDQVRKNDKYARLF